MKYKARHFRTEKPIEITTDSGRIVSIDPISDSPDLPFAGPPPVDMQVNGYMGRDINNVTETTPDDYRVISESFTDMGIPFWVPTIITNSQDNILTLLMNAKKAIDEFPSVSGSVCGIHVEGPYISPDDGPRGAHEKRFVRAPSIQEYNEWQEACGGMVSIVTLAPEYEEAPGFIRAVTEDSTVASLGHCNATREDIKRAVDAGASMATHLGNGAHPMVNRHNCYIWELLAEDRVMAGFIGDGFHLPQAQLQNFIRAKGVERSILTSDMVHIAGLEPGEYKLGDLDVRMQKDGRIVLADNDDIMAGASYHLLYSLKNGVELAGRTKAESWTMASENPAKMLGFTDYPALQQGSTSLFILFEWSDPGGPVIRELIDERDQL